jgi:hypothetical protein
MLYVIRVVLGLLAGKCARYPAPIAVEARLTRAIEYHGNTRGGA